MDQLAAAGFDLCLFPAQTPPEGQMPNFENPTSLQVPSIIVCTIVTFISTVFTAIRVFVNRRKLHAADYCAITASVMSIVYTAVTLSFSKYDRHQWDMPACWFNVTYIKHLYVQLTIFGPTVFFSKAAIFFMYLQFFGIKQTMRIAVYFGLALSFAAYWTSIPIAAYYGAPHPGETWEELFVNLRPAKEAYWGVAQGVCAVFLDIYIFILPLPVLWRLHMDSKKRMQLLGLFGTALIAVAASCVALYFRLKLLPTGKSTPADDTTWTQACTSIAVIIESNIAIIVGSMPAFGAFVRTTSMDSSFFKSWQSKLLRVTGSGRTTGASRKSKPTSWTKESVPQYNHNSAGQKKSAASVSMRQEDPYLMRHQHRGGNTSFDSLEQESTYYEPEPHERSSSAEPLGLAPGAPHYELRDASGFKSEASFNNARDMDVEAQGHQGHQGGIMRHLSVFQEVEPKYPDAAARR